MQQPRKTIVQGRAFAAKQFQLATDARLKRQESKRTTTTAYPTLKDAYRDLGLSDADQLAAALALSIMDEKKDVDEKDEDVYRAGDDWWDWAWSEEERLKQENLSPLAAATLIEETSQVESDRLMALKLLGQHH